MRHVFRFGGRGLYLGEFVYVTFFAVAYVINKLNKLMSAVHV
jgi:hypothetical protein